MSYQFFTVAGVIQGRIEKIDTEDDRVYYCNSKSCLNFSCSLNCWKEHQKIKCESVSLSKNTEDEISKMSSREYEHQTEDTVPLDRLKLLGTLNFMYIH
jgi:predicted GH43/DUF377 family glycosyl hydrolase